MCYLTPGQKKLFAIETYIQDIIHYEYFLKLLHYLNMIFSVCVSMHMLNGTKKVLKCAIYSLGKKGEMLF